MERSIQIFESFEMADDAERRQRWAMSPIQRLELLESLRSLKYPDGKTPQGLQRFFEVAELS